MLVNNENYYIHTAHFLYGMAYNNFNCFTVIEYYE